MKNRIYSLLAICLVAFLVLGAGCVSKPTPTTTTTTTVITKTVSGTPITTTKVITETITPTPTKPKIGEFRIAGGWPFPYHGNPFLPGSVGVAFWLSFEPFAYYVPASGEWIPRLAESWKVEGNTMIVKLRADAKWSDGEDITADDIITAVTFEQAINKRWLYIEKVEKIDDKTVKFVSSEAITIPRMIELLTRPEVSRVPKHIYGQWLPKAEELAKINREIYSYTSKGEEAPKELTDKSANLLSELKESLQKFKPWEENKFVASGAFVPKTVRQDVMVFEVNPHYWAKDKMNIQKVTVYRWSSNDAVWAMLMAGKIDASHPATPKDLTDQIMKLNPNIKLVTPSDLGDFALVFNFREPLFQDINLRKAIAYALDRKKIRDVAYWAAAAEDVYAHNVIKTYESKWLSSEFLNKLTKYPYNPEKAAEILESAGYTKGADGFWRTPDGKIVEFTVAVRSDYSDWVIAAKEITQQLKSFGFKVETELMPGQVYGGRLRGGEFDTAIEFGAAWWGTGDPVTGYDRIFGEQGYIRKVTAFPADKSFDPPWGALVPQQLVRQLALETDPQKRKELVEKLAYISNEYLPLVPFLEKRIMIFYNDGGTVTGWPSQDDPLWSLCPGGIERFYVYLITTGQLKPAG